MQIKAPVRSAGSSGTQSKCQVAALLTRFSGVTTAGCKHCHEDWGRGGGRKRVFPKSS